VVEALVPIIALTDPVVPVAVTLNTASLFVVVDPLTSINIAGVEVPTPIKPELSMRILSRLLVPKVRGCASVVPKKFSDVPNVEVP
jgi:hypothetical protein